MTAILTFVCSHAHNPEHAGKPVRRLRAFLVDPEGIPTVSFAGLWSAPIGQGGPPIIEVTNRERPRAKARQDANRDVRFGNITLRCGTCRLQLRLKRGVVAQMVAKATADGVSRDQDISTDR